MPPFRAPRAWVLALATSLASPGPKRESPQSVQDGKAGATPNPRVAGTLRLVIRDDYLKIT